MDKIKENVTRQLKAILKVDFENCFEPGKEHWDKYMRYQRDCFEKYTLDYFFMI